MKYLVTLIISVLLLGGNSFGQLTTNKDENIHTKKKTEVLSTRKADISQYVNQIFILENAIKSMDVDKASTSVELIKKLSSREIARTQNDIIDLYSNRSKAQDHKDKISSLEKRLKLEKQRFQVINQTKISTSMSSKEASYAISSIKYFKIYMEENYEAIDKIDADENSNKNQKPPVDLTNNQNSGNGMISSSKASSKPKIDPKLNGFSNPEIKQYYENKSANRAIINKYAGEISYAVASGNLGKANGIKQKATEMMETIVRRDNSLLTKIKNGDYKDLNLSEDRLQNTINSENKIIRQFKNTNLSTDKNKVMSLLDSFFALPMNL